MNQKLFWKYVTTHQGVTRTNVLIYATCFLPLADSSSTTQTSSKAASSRKSTTLRTTTTTSKTCNSGDQSCITIKFYEANKCRISDAAAKASVNVLANGNCNRISTDTSTYHYKLSCAGNAITGSFYCDESCRKCRIDKMQTAVDGVCVPKPNFNPDPDSKDAVELIFTGMCEAPAPECS